MVIRPLPWDNALQQLIPNYSTNGEYRPFCLVDELTSRGLFQAAGRFRAGPTAFAQPIDDYIESIHGRNGFSRDRMPATAAAEFDQALRALVQPHCPDGIVSLQVSAEVIFGVPVPS